MALSTGWRVHAVLPRSRANGPGARFTVWSQGCSLACAGCFNPETHAPAGAGSTWRVADLVEAALAELPAIEGVTLTGGEPLEQPAAVAEFCRRIRAGTGLGIVILTGFTRREIEADPARAAAVTSADMVVAGRYNAARHLGTGLRGSDNKVYWARTGRYAAADFTAVPDLEIAVRVDGTVTVTGMSDPEVVA
jgi:anaerobic ribonucleoside-triphosphate reductase activating protein